MKQYFCVWVDHTEANILGVGMDTTNEGIASNQGAKDHAHRSPGHSRHSQAPTSPDFLHSIGEALLLAGGIIIVGPDRTKTDLIAHLREQFPAVAKKIWPVAAVDHPIDGELVVAARQFFKTATRVHS